jgi:hypothetical protein
MVETPPERIRAARDAWLAAMAAHEAHRLEVNRLWLEYVELADPERAKQLRRFLKHDEARRVDELFPEAAISLFRPEPSSTPRVPAELINSPIRPALAALRSLASALPFARQSTASPSPKA